MKKYDHDAGASAMNRREFIGRSAALTGNPLFLTFISNSQKTQKLF